MRRSDPIKSYNGDKDGMIHPLEEKMTPSKHQAKKDTKRWCKGIEGREHFPVETLVPFVRHRYKKVVACDNCGKVLDWKWGSGSVDIRDTTYYKGN